METRFEAREAQRFLRTLRVTTGVAVAAESLRRRQRAPAATFMALAARTGAWRFPEDGLLSGDGLLLARRTVEPDGSGALILQAQGAVGVSTYAGRPARVRVGEAWSAEGAFDRFGSLKLPLASDELDEEALAQFEVEMLDDAS